MGASSPDTALTGRRVARWPGGAILVVTAVAASGSAAQELATPTLAGTVFVGEESMRTGTVVLHHLSDGNPGELDSVGVGEEGRFRFSLPSVPDPARNDLYFASVRHQGVLYFGPAITTAVQLDSVYEIHAYDTLLAPEEGAAVPLQSRSIFFEPDTTGWRVTDLFQLRNDTTKTIVARSGGAVWRHPLPVEATRVEVGEGELSSDAIRYEDGDIVVRSALPPGERLFVVRYRVESPLLSLPNRGTPEALDVLVREPAPALEVEGLELLDRVELEAGSTYLRFTGADVALPAVRIVATEELRPPRAEWVAVILALIMAAVGVMILRSGPGDARASTVRTREELVLEVARLDEAFDAETADVGQRKRYERRREELIRRILERS